MAKSPPPTNDNRLILHGDEAKQSIGEDEFGLSLMVEAVANALVSQLSDSGYVIGIEGKWGSGKTTFVNFVSERIIRTSPNHHVIQFEPWLIGSRESLLSHFFGLLAAKIDSIDDRGLMTASSPRLRRTKGLKLGEKLRLYGQWAGIAAIPAANLATWGSGHPLMSAAALALQAYSASSKLSKSRVPSLDALKSDIESDLKTFARSWPNLRFCVIIDDLDRLENSEAIEILRLVKKVGDFPRLTYLLCFDRDILARQVRRALAAVDGNDFLEKIFQNIVTLPPQEPFALRRHLKRRLTECFPSEMGASTVMDADIEYRKVFLFDRWAGKLLTTPRDVSRLIDAVKFGWPAISNEADFFDFVWLQLVKLKSSKLYSWTQRYLAGVGAYRDAGRPGDTEPRDEAEALKTIMDEMKWGPRYFISGLDKFLPGLKSFIIKGEGSNVLECSRDELAEFERDRRLGSPSHWRRYFAFDKPSYAIGDAEIAEFRRVASSNPPEAAKTLMTLATRPHDHAGHFLDVFLDRLSDNSLSPGEIAGMGLAFAEVMDDIARKLERDVVGGRIEIWKKASALTAKGSVIDVLNLIESGPSINWLASVLRSHALPKGRFDTGDAWINGPNRDRAVSAIISRFRDMGPEEIFRQPEPLVILMCWRMFGDQDEFLAFMEEATGHDEGFLDALGAMRSWVSSSEKGVYYPLSKPVIAQFLDADKAKTRLQRLASKGDDVSGLHQRASELLNQFEDH